MGFIFGKERYRVSLSGVLLRPDDLVLYAVYTIFVVL